MRGSFSSKSAARKASRQSTGQDVPNVQEPAVYHGKMHSSAENATVVDVIIGVSIESIQAVTIHQHKIIYQCQITAMKEVVWDHTEKSVHFVLHDGSESPAFSFPILTDLEAHLLAIFALPELEKQPEQVYVGVLVGRNVPSPINQRRASLGSSSPPMLPMSKRRELLRREQPVRNAVSRERLGVEYFRNGYLSFTCFISGDLRGLTLGSHHIRVFPSPDCHDRSACLFSYVYEYLESCEVMGTRLELRFRTTSQLAKQPACLVFQSLEAQYIREAIWYLKHGTYMDASLREVLSARSLQSSPRQASEIAPSRRLSALMFFADGDSLRQRIDSCCQIIGCPYRVDSNDESSNKPIESSGSSVMIHINTGEPSHVNSALRTTVSVSRVATNSICDHHAACLSSTSNAKRMSLSRDKLPFPAKSLQPLVDLVQSSHYAKMLKFQGQLLKRKNGRTFHLRKPWHLKLAVLFETPVGGFLCYYDRIAHCPGMTDSPKERRVIDLSSVLCIRPVSATSPARGSGVSTSPVHAFDVVTLYRTWTFAALEPEVYEVWIHVLTEAVEKHASMAPDRSLRFPVKLAMTGKSSPSEATSLEISAFGVSFCTGHDSEVVLSTWYYTDLEKWSVVLQQGCTCCLLQCRSEAVTQEYLFRTTEASVICLAIEFYVSKCMAKLEVLAGLFLEGSRDKVNMKTGETDAAERNPSSTKLNFPAGKEIPIQDVDLAPVGSPEKKQITTTADNSQQKTEDTTSIDQTCPPLLVELESQDTMKTPITLPDTEVLIEDDKTREDISPTENSTEPLPSAVLTEVATETTPTVVSLVTGLSFQRIFQVPSSLVVRRSETALVVSITLPQLLNTTSVNYTYPVANANIAETDTTQESNVQSADESIKLVHEELVGRPSPDEGAGDENSDVRLTISSAVDPCVEVSSHQSLIGAESEVSVAATIDSVDSPSETVVPPLNAKPLPSSTTIDKESLISLTEREDDRKSECESSDRSDAFNSCASDVEMVPDVSAVDQDAFGSADCSDDVFEDALDLEVHGLR